MSPAVLTSSAHTVKLHKLTNVARITNAVVKAAAGTSENRTGMSPIWQKVLQDHIAKLRDTDRALCAPLPCCVKVDQDSLAKTFKELRLKYESGSFHRFLDKIRPVAEHVLSFGRAIDIAVGGGDFGAGFIWGGIRILLAVSHRSYFVFS